MLSNLRLNNFQRFKSKSIKFAPGVTTFVGATHAGKTTILRAIGFALLNKWHKSYLRHGQKSVKIVAKVDGKKITRSKASKVNTYKLGKKKFSALGQGNVPPEVAELLNVGEENFQRQLDSHFWFTDTPGQVSKKLNHIVNLEAIDKTLAEIAAITRQAKSEVDLSEKRLRQAKAKKDKLAWVPRFYAEYSEVLRLKKEIEHTTRKIEFATRTLSQLLRLRREIKTSGNAILCGSKAVVAGQNASKAEREYKTAKKLLLALKKADKAARMVVPDISELLKVREDADRAAEKVREVEGFIAEILSLEEDLCQIETSLESSVRLLAKRTKGRCPYCGAKMKKIISVPDKSVPF